MIVTVLRLGHRIFRDQRITTHCALVARAFGAKNIILCGDRDQKLEENIKKTVGSWGGPFGVEHASSWKKAIAPWKKRGVVVHLTMYGLPLEKEVKKIRNEKNVMVVIGSEKVPGEVYGLADYNVSVTNQPHSEVAALAVFLHELFKGKELGRKFKNARIRLVPQERGKKIIRV